ncbi:MAG TPA: DUF3054 domain-containing protein [Segeticoccus sp.]|uniref:DUF3054 domain-containing protein n=1 Tax=Segeticoccus sp. TaxID=2706531 RepID=UPI002D805413|nr:DUF3054 domain-containing protein [Segeticoccus sp.]HET8598745.1 DUF3054 domain-containing protein [Segeticoccus sp.]
MPLPRRLPTALAALVDGVLVLLFAGLGRRSHHEGGAFLGTLQTAWPFLAGAAAGWALLLLARRGAPVRVRLGIPVWVAAVAGGMLLRAATGQGTAWAFVVVATVVLAAFLLGWRALAQVASARHRGRHDRRARTAPADR